MHILFSILFLGIIIVLIIGFSLVFSVLSFVLNLFGINRRPSATHAEQASSPKANRQSEPKETFSPSQPSKHKKIFDEDEGEYVEFEEIKE